MRTFLLLLCFFFCQNIFAQSDFTKRFSIGVANNSTFLKGNNEVNTNNVFAPGLFTTFFFKDKLAMEVSFFWEKINYQYTREYDFEDSILTPCSKSTFIANIKESYFHLNQHFKYYFRKNKMVSPFIGLGYSIRFINDTDANSLFKKSDGSILNITNTEGNKNYFHPGFHSGAGVDFFIKNKFMFTFQTGWNYFVKNKFARYNPVLNRIDTDGVKYSLNNIFIKVGCAYFFNKKGKE